MKSASKSAAPAQPTLSEQGLARVPAATLRRLAELLRRERPPHPLTEQALQAEGIAHDQALIACLSDLDPAAQLRVLGLVLAERATRQSPRLQVVWTGPEAHTATARDTAVLLRDLFAQAQRSVLLAGFRFDHGKRILAPLHEAMRDREVTVTVFADLGRTDHDPRTLDQMLADFRTRFLRDNWPFGGPYPRVYYDPRQAVPYVSLHAKCAIIDHQQTLITSANFTDRGLTRNIELGVLVEDRDFATQVSAQWMGLVHARLVQAVELK